MSEIKWNFEFENEIWEDLGALINPVETFEAVKEIVQAKLHRMEGMAEESVLVYKQRLRKAAQVLVEGLGEEGEWEIEIAVAEAVARIRYLEDAIVKARSKLVDAEMFLKEGKSMGYSLLYNSATAYRILNVACEAKPGAEVSDEMKKAVSDFLASVPFGPGYKMGGGDGQG